MIDEELLARDLAPLKEHAAAAVAYVLTGEREGVLADIAGRDVLAVKATSSGSDVRAPREVTRAFGDEDAAAFVRLGRVYSATCRDAGVMEELEGARWAEHLVWESGHSSPDFEASGASTFELEWIARGMGDVAPLVSAMLAHRPAKEFERYAFWMNALGARDIAPFLENHERLVNAILRTGELTAIKRLEQARAPVAPFARVLAKLAADPRAPIRKPAFEMLARDPRAARTELEAVVDDPDTDPKARRHALAALDKLFA